MINFQERVGTHGADSIYAIHGQIAYTGPGDDQLFLQLYEHAYLIGGSGNDTYWPGTGSFAVILDTSGHDTIEAPFRLAAGSTYAATVDGGRHLLVGDVNTGTLIFIVDAKNHPVETFSFLNFSTSQQGMESAIRGNGLHVGDISYRQMEQLGFGTEEFWSTAIREEIAYIVNRENALFPTSPELGPVPPPGPAPGPGIPQASLIDSDWYLNRNPDVAAANIDAATHYMNWGWQEGRNPNNFFDTKWYLATYSDVAGAGMNPLAHYMDFGWKEGRDPSPRFDTSHYLETNTDVALAGVNPLEHYLHWGIWEGREIAPVVGS